MSHSGFYLSLSRDAAKQLFAQRGDEAVREYVERFLQAGQNQVDGLILDCGADWELIHRALTDGTLDPLAGELPLNHAVLGGRHLYQGDDFYTVLVRPDLTAHVADAIQGLDDGAFRAGVRDIGRDMDEETTRRVLATLRRIGEWFRHAAEHRHAVVFTAPRG